MRTKFLFSTLAMAAAFSACTQDEVAVNNENVGSFDKVVGAKQIASGFDFAPVVDANSRVVAGEDGYSWSEGDKVAVAWTVDRSGKVYDSQTGKPLNNLSTNIYANHMLVHDGTRFESRSNVYEGWHFAYSPFQYMTKPGELSVELNAPLRMKDLEMDEYVNAPMFSNAAFITEDDVDFESGKIKTAFPLQWITNSIRPVLQPASQFKEEALLNYRKITKVTLNVKDHNLFTNKFTVNPAGLQEIPAKIDETYFGEGKAFVPAKLEASVSAPIEGDFTLAEDNKVRIFLAPTQDASGVELADLSFQVEVEGGWFFIDGAEVEEGSVNAQAFDTILKMLKGTLTIGDVTFDLTKTNQNPKTVTFELLAEDFNTDFSHISDVDEWMKAVDLVEALKLETAEFAIDGAIEFTTENGGLTADGKLYMPTSCQITVNSADDNSQADNNLYLKEGTLTEWPANLTSNVWFAVEADGVWKNAHINNQNGRVVNRGTIEVPAGTKDKVNVMGNTVTNHNLIKVGEYAQVSGVTNHGRIEVVWGSYVTTNRTKGIIAYNVTAEDVNVPERIQLLTATTEGIEGQTKYASVNTLVIGNGISIDLTKKIAGSEDVYENNPYGSFNQGGHQDESTYNYGDLENVNFEINGGTVISSTTMLTVADVTMNGGNVDNIQINALTINGGTNSVNVANPQNIASVEISAGSSTVYAKEIAGNVTALAGENAVHAETIKGNVAVAGDRHEIVANSIEASVTVDGDALINAEVNNNVTINSGATGLENIKIDGDLTIAKGASVKIGGKDATIDNIQNSGNLTANTDVYTETVAIYKGSNAVVEDGKVIWYTTPTDGQYGYIQEGTTSGSIRFLGDVVLASTIEQLQAALDNATGDATIALTSDLAGDVTVTQKEGVNITIDGENHKYDGTIYIYGKARNNGAETLTIQKVNFEANAKKDFISCNSTDSDKRYAHNVTVSDCTFNGNNAEVVGMRYRQCYNMKVVDCQATGVHSLMWATGCSSIEIENVEVEGLNGVSLNTSVTNTVKNSKFTATADYGYAIRVDANGAYTLNVEGCELKADAPILLRNATGAYTLNLSNSTLTTTKDYQLITTAAGDYKAGTELTAATGTLTLNGVDGLATNN